MEQDRDVSVKAGEVRPNAVPAGGARPDAVPVGEARPNAVPAGEVPAPVGGSPGSGGTDPVLEALEGLEETLEASAATERALGEQVRRLRARRERGLSWRDATAGTDGTDGVLAVLGTVLNGLTEAGSVLRRVLAATLVEEGASTAEVAQRFGVSRQRVFRLLRGRDQEVSRGE